MTAKIKSDGTLVGVSNLTEFLVKAANTIAKIKAETVVALTDSSTGDATPAAATVQAVAAFVNEADVATSLAKKTETETALGKVKNAITELATKANEYATILGVTGLTDESGGTAADDTIAALDQSTVAAATGVVIASVNPIRVVINDAFAEITKVTNRCCVAAGVAELAIDYDDFEDTDGTIAEIATDGGTAADPGISAAAIDAALVKWADNVAFIAAKLNVLTATAATQVTVI